MSFDKAGRTDLIGAWKKTRSDKGKKRGHRAAWKPKPRKDKGKTRRDPKLVILEAATDTLPKCKGGRLSPVEKLTVEAMVASVKGDESLEQLNIRGRALAMALGRSPAAIRKAVVEARERIQSRAGDYADLHFEATKVAAKEGDAKPAEWALERITAPSESGKGVERIVQPLKTSEEGPRMPVVNIGVSLGGISAGASLKTHVAVKELPPIDVEAEP